jgi:hypothetical protein
MADLVSMMHKLPCSSGIVATPKEHLRAKKLFDREICSTGAAMNDSRNRARKEEEETLQHTTTAATCKNGTWRSGDALSTGDAAIAAAAARRW